MLRRELLRILLLAALGVAAGCLFLPAQAGLAWYWRWILAPLYLVGLFYAGRILLQMVGKLFRFWGQWQMFSFFSRPFFGTLLCGALLVAGLAFVAAVGWFIGLVRCVLALIQASQSDQYLA
jgi:hypothetical protein